MQRHRTGQSRQHKQQIKQTREDISQPRNTMESNIEHTWQSNEHQSRTGIHTDTVHTEHRRENKETTQHSNRRINSTHTHRRLRQSRIRPEVRSISAKTTHRKAQRIKSLPYSTQNNTARNLREVRLQQKAKPLGTARHTERTNNQYAYNEKQHRHHQLRTPLNARLHTTSNDNVCQSHKSQCHQHRHPRVRHKIIIDKIVIPVSHQLSSGRLNKVEKRPSAHNYVVGKNDKGNENACHTL